MTINGETIYFIINLAILILIIGWAYKKKVSNRAKKEQLKGLYKDQPVYLCDDGEDLGDNLIQLYGEPFGVNIRPGMKITGPNGAEHTVKEVYANDKTPDKPDEEIPSGMEDTAIVIDANNWDWRIFKLNLKTDRVIALKVH